MVNLVSEIQCDEQRCGSFKETSLVKRSGIDGAHTGNHFGNPADSGFCFGVVAANQRIAVDGLVDSREGFRAEGMKSGHDLDARWDESRGLLRG